MENLVERRIVEICVCKARGQPVRLDVFFLAVLYVICSVGLAAQSWIDIALLRTCVSRKQGHEHGSDEGTRWLVPELAEQAPELLVISAYQFCDPCHAYSLYG